MIIQLLTEMARRSLGLEPGMEANGFGTMWNLFYTGPESEPFDFSKLRARWIAQSIAVLDAQIDVCLAEILSCSCLSQGIRYRTGVTGSGGNRAYQLFAEHCGLSTKRAVRLVQELVQSGRLIEREYTHGRKIKYGLFLSDAEVARLVPDLLGPEPVMSDEEAELWK